MKKMADAIADLIGSPRPVLCLDTCVFLDVIRTVSRGRSELLPAVKKLLEFLAVTPDRVQVLITSLVALEWKQNVVTVKAETAKWLTETDGRVTEIYRAWDRIGKPLPGQSPIYNKPALLEELAELAKSLIDNAMVLKEDDACVSRALGRVKSKRRPSHTKEVKDSIHFEHYLDLSRQLHAAGYGEPRMFVSTNSTDFWTDKSTSSPHPELVPDLIAAHLTFFGGLPVALRQLGILPAAAVAPAVAPVAPVLTAGAV